MLRGLFRSILGIMLTADQIQTQVRERLEELRPLVEEFTQLERASEALGPLVQSAQSASRPPSTAPVGTDHEAPYGRKADGSPRKRPGRRSGS